MSYPLELSPAEKVLFDTLIRQNVSAALFEELKFLVTISNQEITSSVYQNTDNNKFKQKELSKQVVSANYMTNFTTFKYLQKWIDKNMDNANLLSTKQINIPNESVDLSLNYELTPEQKFFNFLVVKTANYLGEQFTLEKNKLASKISIEICTESGLIVDLPPIIGGCAGTRYGCCPDKVTAKIDEAGSNCLPIIYKK